MGIAGDFNNCALTDDDIAKICDGLEISQEIHRLDPDLDWNEITDYGASDLAEATKFNKTIEIYNLKLKSFKVTPHSGESMLKRAFRGNSIVKTASFNDIVIKRDKSVSFADPPAQKVSSGKREKTFEGGFQEGHGQ